MNFIEEAIAAGFTKEQAEFMEAWLADECHSHDMSEVIGLEAALQNEEDEEDEENE